MSAAKPNSVPILVVDDEELIAAALGEILRQAGYAVMAFCRPMLALDALKQQEFSVVISDQRMPGLSGLELLAEARRLQPNATRILITGVLDLDTVIEAINQGEIFRFIVKPWLREEFLATITNALHRYELLCQNSRLEASAQAVQEELLKTKASLQEQTSAVVELNQRLADLAAAATRSHQRSQEFWLQVLETFHAGLAAETRCVYQLCRPLGNLAGLSGSEQRALEDAAGLYDLGCLHLSRQVIRTWQNAPDSLTSTEWEFIRRHPKASEQLATYATGSDLVGRTVRSHHEQVNGAGYPDGLRGEKIPRLARLLAPLVAYASSSLPPQQALQRMQSGAGSLFDAQAVQLASRAILEAGLPSKERQVTLADLAPGMVLAKGIYSQTGVLLAAEGELLNEGSIRNLRGHTATHPLTPTFAVYC